MKATELSADFRAHFADKDNKRRSHGFLLINMIAMRVTINVRGNV